MNNYDEIKLIIKKLPENCKIKAELSHINILERLVITKLFIQYKGGKNGSISYFNLLDIIQNDLGFKVSKEELDLILYTDYINNYQNIENEVYSIDNLASIVNLLKKEKLIIKKLITVFNYFIFSFIIAVLMFFILNVNNTK